MVCPKCEHEFDPTTITRRYTFWQLVARDPKHPVWILLYMLPWVIVTAVICTRFDADEITKLATGLGGTGLIALLAGALSRFKRANGV